MSEAQWVAAGCGGVKATALHGEPQAIFRDLSTLGEVMALTRNDWCVHERHGRYQDIQADGPVGLVLGPDIDLRVFFSCWRSAWAVEQDGRYSLQFFDGEGVAVHKVYRTEATDVAAYDALVARHAGPSRWPGKHAGRARVRRRQRGRWRAVARAAWLGMKDTHEFFPLLRSSRSPGWRRWPPPARIWPSRCRPTPSNARWSRRLPRACPSCASWATEA